MRDPLQSVRDIRLVRPDNEDYVAYMRRMADLRPSRGGPRQAGEMLGGLVERAVRHWLSTQVPLQEERILSWEQRLSNGRHGRLYRELDAVWPIDAESLALFEIKFTTPERMAAGVGLDQLDLAAGILSRSKTYRYLLLRLVYVAAQPIPVLADEENPEGVPVLPPSEEYEELGVVWVPPTIVEESALALGLDLPQNWLDPEAREGVVEDPEREAWRLYVEGDSAGPSESPLAAALKRLLEERTGGNGSDES